MCIRDRHGTARLSRTVLVLFSGDYNRDDGLIAFLRRLGLRVIALDNDAANGGNAAHDLLRDEVFEHLLHLASRGGFLGIFAAPPCSTFSIARFAPHEEGHDGGPPPIRTRLHIRGIPNCPPKFRRKLKEANLLVDRTCAILTAATEAGSEWALENPCDRGLPVAHGGRRDLFADPRHGSIWQMPASSSSPGLHLAIWSRFPCVISLPIGRNIPAFSSHRAFNVSSSSMGSGVRTSPTTRERAAPSKTASGIPPRRQHTRGSSTSTWRRPFIT